MIQVIGNNEMKSQAIKTIFFRTGITQMETYKLHYQSNCGTKETAESKKF